MRVKGLRQASPPDIMNQNLFFVRPGVCSARFLKLFQQAYGGDVVGKFCFGTANAKLIIRAYSVIFRLISTPAISKISQSLIPRSLACRADSLLKAWASFCCWP